MIRRHRHDLPLPSAGSLLLRHAERPPIPPGSFGNDLPITDAGRQAAEALGARMGNDLRRIVTSPVRRCLETARALAQGATSSVPIETDARLGAPGAWIEDPAEAEAQFHRLGTRNAYDRLMAGEPVPGLTSLDDGARILLDLLRPPPDATGLHCFISHDAVIAPLLAWQFPELPPSSLWPDYLDGALFLDSGER